MKASVWMTAAAATVSMVAGFATDRGTALGVALGVCGPLVAAIVTRLVVARTMATDPTRLNDRLLQGFAAKAVGFGVYLVLVIREAGATPLPFVISFTAAFLVFHVVEAILLHRCQRLTASRTPAVVS